MWKDEVVKISTVLITFEFLTTSNLYQHLKIWKKYTSKSQILVHEYWTILDHFCVPVL